MMNYFFNDEWKNWIWSNINNGVSKQRIYDDLIKNNYDVFTIINELKFIPEIFRKKDEIHSNQVIESLEKFGAKKITAAIPLYTLENFLTEMECTEIIAIQKNTSYRSTVADGKDKRIDEKRTSFTTHFESVGSDSTGGIVQQVKARILSMMNIPSQYSETLQGQWYKKNGLYHDHFDAYDDYNQFKFRHGNRTWTCMITLNEVEEGGETYFPNLKTKITPKIGQALIWYNLDENGLAHPLSLHTGQSIKKGEKFIITQWFHQCTD